MPLLVQKNGSDQGSRAVSDSIPRAEHGVHDGRNQQFPINSIVRSVSEAATIGSGSSLERTRMQSSGRAPLSRESSGLVSREGQPADGWALHENAARKPWDAGAHSHGQHSFRPGSGRHVSGELIGARGGLASISRAGTRSILVGDVRE